jgi:general nucleoside transport system ATP-binding protein
VSAAASLDSLDEVMSVSDRIAVMYRGKIIATVDASTATREQLGLLMAGVTLDQVAQKLGESQPTDPALRQLGIE